MPKDKSSRCYANKSHDLFYKPYKLHQRSSSSSKEEDDAEWEGATCPICMEPPHNAVLLLCSSHAKGCRPYMCDTSYRHSNCLDQYIKAHSSKPEPSSTPAPAPAPAAAPARVHRIPHRASPQQLQQQQQQQQQQRQRQFMFGDNNNRSSVNDEEDEENEEERYTRAQLGLNLVCPLCRGKVGGWKVVQPARGLLNMKQRSCAQDGCSFSGAYEELRKHARVLHPLARPSEIDPDRQRQWRLLERQRDFGDVLSSIHSSIPNATVYGDYVLEEGDGTDDDEDQQQQQQEEDEDEDAGMVAAPPTVAAPPAAEEGQLFTMLLLFQVLDHRQAPPSHSLQEHHHRHRHPHLHHLHRQMSPAAAAASTRRGGRSSAAAASSSSSRVEETLESASARGYHPGSSYAANSRSGSSSSSRRRRALRRRSRR